ncbi:MAG: hypothetical protein K6F09_04040 [Clostridiales bacterium]|nr:hypothetical protein [Clostridiales bacterium]
MIGLGKWLCHVNTMLFRGDAYITIFDDGGKYGFSLDVQGADIPGLNIKDVKEDGNTLTASAETSMLPGKEIPISLTFDGDTVSGTAKIPFIGNIKLKDGKRVG